MACSEGRLEKIEMKKTLIHTNACLKDEVQREALLRTQALDSSVFEGATGLTDQRPTSRDLPSSSNRTRRPSSKKSVNKR